jgi:hypothetical protein
MKFKINKIGVKETPRPQLKPLEVTFTIENENDLAYLTAILNLSEGNIKKVSEYPHDIKWKKPDSGFEYWHELDEILKDHMDRVYTWQKITGKE